MSKDDIANATSFEHCHGSGKKVGSITWDILRDTEYLYENDHIQFDNDSSIIMKELNWDNLNETFFDHIFPSIEGHAKMIDEYLSDHRAEFHKTVHTSKIKFDDPEANDPDWRVKRCYTLLIAASCEVECGIDNLWKNGQGNGRKELPNFGKYVPRDAFKAFCSAAPYAFCNRKYWYIDKRDRPWDIFMPCISSYNLKRRNIIKSVLLLLDESMSAWRPKTSKLGGLPNITFEPRKPVPLGTMFKNGAECITGIIAFQDIVMGAEVQQRKKYFGENSVVPGQQTIPSHTAEVLRQVEGAHIPPNGWVGGDAWFGSVSTAIEVFKKFNVHSTWIIKNNTYLYPMEVLHSILQARFPKPVGHWVVLKSTVQGVRLLACAYAWSHSRISYFLTTTGNTNPSKQTYRTQFEDEFGCVNFKDIPRPVFADMLYDFLPLIDEHNKQRQSILNLEKSWPTRNVWFRLLTTVVGMSVVDFHRLFLNTQKKLMPSSKKYSFDDNNNYVNIRKFADLICHSLGHKQFRPWSSNSKNIGTIKKHSVQKYLKRIEDAVGRINREPTEKQRKRRKESGNPYTKNCYVCRKYLDVDGLTVYNTTQWCCVTCGMPICAMDRTLEGSNSNRKLPCLHEHLYAQVNDPVACTLHRPQVFPKCHQVPFDKAQIENSNVDATRNHNDIPMTIEPSRGKNIDVLKRKKPKPKPKQNKIPKKKAASIKQISPAKKYELRTRTKPKRKSKRKKIPSAKL